MFLGLEKDSYEANCFIHKKMFSGKIKKTEFTYYLL